MVFYSVVTVKYLQRRARKISKKNEEERIRTAKDIQKTLQETELRKNEVIVVGTDLEKRLKEGECLNQIF